MKSKYYGSLYNPVSYSTFRVADINLSEASGFLTVWLSGKYRPSGNKCDNTRVKAKYGRPLSNLVGLPAQIFILTVQTHLVILYRMMDRDNMTNKVHWIGAFILVSMVFMALSGCSPAGKLPDQSQSATLVRPEVVSTVMPIATQAPPTETSTRLPPTTTLTATATPSPTDTVTPEPTATETPPPPTPSGDQAVYIYLVQTGTGGPVACGDSLIKVNTGLPRSGDNATDISAALRRLLVKRQWMVGLYNPAIYQI